MKRKAILLTLLILLLLAHTVQAMSSTNFKLDWFTPLTSNGGGPASSAQYAANYTIGQTAIGATSSTNYGIHVGYWYAILPNFRIRLPLVIR